MFAFLRSQSHRMRTNWQAKGWMKKKTQDQWEMEQNLYFLSFSHECSVSYKEWILKSDLFYFLVRGNGIYFASCLNFLCLLSASISVALGHLLPGVLGWGSGRLVRQAHSSRGNLPENHSLSWSPSGCRWVEQWLRLLCIPNHFSWYFRLISMLCYSKYCLLAGGFPVRMDQIACEVAAFRGLPPANHWAMRDPDVSLWDCQDLSWDAERREPESQTLILSLENSIMLFLFHYSNTHLKKNI